ncbi:hypothetical protein STXM2123_5965 [Streptomyces sp. F-3]|nr:hypothetical protein STXM2123_5965 [Streptomyces sp. F-3]
MFFTLTCPAHTAVLHATINPAGMDLAAPWRFQFPRGCPRLISRGIR